MEQTHYDKIGSCEKRDENYYFIGGESDQGIIFKDGEAYETDWDAPCYVPEYGFPEGSLFEGLCDYYTHRNLLEMCYNNERLCDAVFQTVDWQFPETYLNELCGGCDYKEFWPFVKIGAKVKWNDPTRETSGIYEVFEVPTEHEWDLESIVKITNGVSEAEVLLCELEDVGSKFCKDEE